MPLRRDPILVLVANCFLCATYSKLFDKPIEPLHCYGDSDRVTPGVMGGFQCACECRHWEKPPSGLGTRGYYAREDAMPAAKPEEE